MKRGVPWVVVQLVLAVVYLTLPWREPRPASPLATLGFLALGSGLSLFLAGLLTMGRAITPLPIPADDAKLLTHGPFSLVRHPLYSGLIFAAFGWAVVSDDAARLTLAVALLVFFDAKARVEEKALAQKFPGYAEYCRRVKRFIPWVY